MSVGPVISDVRAIVVADHIQARTCAAPSARAAARVGAGATRASLRLGDEAVHTAAKAFRRIATVHVLGRVSAVVRSPVVDVAAVVEGPVAAAVVRVGKARLGTRVAGQPRNTVRAGEGAEV